jgi:hypothetical protein
MGINRLQKSSVGGQLIDQGIAQADAFVANFHIPQLWPEIGDVVK